MEIYKCGLVERTEILRWNNLGWGIKTFFTNKISRTDVFGRLNSVKDHKNIIANDVCDHLTCWGKIKQEAFY